MRNFTIVVNNSTYEFTQDVILSTMTLKGDEAECGFQGGGTDTAPILETGTGNKVAAGSWNVETGAVFYTTGISLLMGWYVQ